MNPQMILNNMLQNNPIMQNPIFSNAIRLYQNKDYKGLENLANNVCKETGTTPDQIKQQICNRFNF